MGESASYNPYEQHETFGNPAQDLSHAAEMSLRHRNIDATPDNVAYETKRIAYDHMAKLLAKGAQEVEMLAELRSVDIFSLDSMQRLLQEMVYFAISEPGNDDLVLNAAVSYELREDADVINLNNEAGGYITDAFKNTLGDHGLEDANQIQAILALGAATAGRVMSAYWRMISEHLPEGADFYEVARSDASLKTLVLITRSWHLSEVDDGIRSLGIAPRSRDDQVMDHNLFDITVEGASIKSSAKPLFRSSYPDERVSCPAGRVVDLANEHGEVERVMPIKEIAGHILDTWHKQQYQQEPTRDAVRA